ncbi:MAG: glycoside hydrolase family 3 C-terminal domain-containing protein [Oscillospiraceae bacterium]|nr:glycoside hydrolase family 3 C-terminal domain-containing protein [Oscillospiraceae bacterium]
MLRNENRALPLPQGEQIAVFGRMQLHYYKSGTGSGGMVNVSKVTGILDGLLEAGVRVYEPLLAVYRKWDEAHPYDLGEGWGGEPWSQEEMPLSDALVQQAAAVCSRAVVVIGRTAGEEQDNRLAKGSFYLTDQENEMLRLCRAHFQYVIVLLNTGNLVDMHFVEAYAPDSVLYVWQGGMTGGTGTAAVLTGAVSPSGKLPDTIAREIRDYPSDKNFGNPDVNYYQEDIYVGYRYFETFARDCVLYPFGFGLSYTSFSVHSLQDGRRIRVTVTNTGAAAGKEVVQLYCEAPQGKLGKPSRLLLAFRKTRLLQPGESEQMLFCAEVPGSYDDSGVTGHAHAWVIEAGEYRYYVGTSVRDAEYIGCLQQDELLVVLQCRQAMPPVRAFQRMKPEVVRGGIRVAYEDVPLMQFDEAARRMESLPDALPEKKAGIVLADVLRGDADMDSFIAQLSDSELAQMMRGEGMGSPRVTPGTASAFGGVTDALSAYGIPAGCCSDGPSGMRLDCGTKAFSLPNGTMLASTFNPPLLTGMFTCVGLEMAANHVDCLLGPGMNLHRHPLNGRNFEYFSEDPYLTGMIAAAELRGLHAAGVTGTLKHFCGNNQETRRHFLDGVVSERALRELYLRSFEIAVIEGEAQSVMTTYGSVNGLWTAGNYDLVTEILRKEWGFTGFVMTDWWANINERGQGPDQRDFAAMVRAQNDVYMVCADCETHDDNIMEALREGTLTRGELQRNAANICRFLLHTNAMKRLLGEDTEPQIVNRPAEEQDSGEPVVFYELPDSLTIPLSGICTDRGTSFSFALDAKTPGWYRVTLTASSTQGALAQIPVTLFSMGTASGTFTWNGTDGKPVSFSKKIPIFSRYSALRLYFAQSGLHMESIRFDALHEEPVDLSALAEQHSDEMERKLDS